METGSPASGCHAVPFVRWKPCSGGGWALQEVGFRAFAWHPTEVAPDDIARYGEAYWRDVHDNCSVIGLGVGVSFADPEGGGVQDERRKKSSCSWGYLLMNIQPTGEGAMRSKTRQLTAIVGIVLGQ